MVLLVLLYVPFSSHSMSYLSNSISQSLKLALYTDEPQIYSFCYFYSIYSFSLIHLCYGLELDIQLLTGHFNIMTLNFKFSARLYFINVQRQSFSCLCVLYLM